MVIALPALAEILFWVGALIFCLLCVYIAKALFGVAGGTLGKLPVVGGWINGGLTSLEHKIVATMSGAAASVDSHIGDAFHRLARILDWTGREIRSHAGLLGLIASYLPGFATLNMIRSLIADLRRLIHAAHALGVHALIRTVTITKTVAKSVAANVYPRLRAVEREAGRVVTRDIPRLRAKDAAIEKEITNLWKWTRSHALVAGSVAFAGAVALALARLGLGWVRCSKVGRAGKTLCGMDDSLLESLLADTLAIVGTVSLIEFIRDAQAVEHVALEALGGFIRELPQV